MPDFVHLHNHSEYSLLDGLSKITDMVGKAKELGMNALALTDHGVMYGIIKFYLECRDKGIKPILGCETYVAQRSRFDKQSGIDSDQYHLILLAKNNEGYKNLMKIVTLSHLEGFYYKPRVDFEILEKYHKGIIALSACIEGQVPSLFLSGRDEEAETAAGKYLSIFGEDYYLEIQSHEGINKQAKANEKLVLLSRKLGIPLVATNDCHYVNKEDSEAQDALLAVQTKKMLDDKNRLSMLSSPNFYLRSPQEMAGLFPDYPEAIENSVKISQKCNVEIQIGKWILPHYPLVPGKTAENTLKEMTRERFPSRFPDASDEIKKRLEYELGVICSKGFATYFLVVQDFVNWAKKTGIRVGPGRGSAAGSLVSYVLRITSINPLEHGLPFERFMNPDRPTPPDIDLDFAEDRRDEVIAYVTKTYGTEKVAQIITFGTMEARGSIRDIGRILGMPYSEPDVVAKLMPFGFSIDQALKNVPELAQMYHQDKYKKLLDLARKVEGGARHASTHAAGVVIADRELTEYTPLQKESKGERIITQYDMYSLDLNVSDRAVGLLKMDFLGLRNLTILQKAIDFVCDQTGKTVDVSEIPLDDKKVYDMLSRGETSGVFQLESTGMRRLAKNLRPSRFSDIAAMVALYRPGPMDLIPEFVRGKLNPQSVVYPHPDLKRILEETYGIAVYQEQCLEIAHDMAGYSMGEADILRRAIGKKKKSIMDKEHQKFMSGAKKKGYEKKTADKVWHYIERFAGYGFNKAHSASYAMIAYETAYMKANYPVEFMAALLTAESDNKDKIAVEVDECRRMGIVVQPPDINKSNVGFTLEPDESSLQKKAIRFGLTAIKNVGTAAINEILSVRSRDGAFNSLTDFCIRTDNQKVNKKVVESLIQVGAFTQWGTRAAMLSGLDRIRSQTEEEHRRKANGQGFLFDGLEEDKKPDRKAIDNLPQVEELSSEQLLSLEKGLLGFYFSRQPNAEDLAKVAHLATHKVDEIGQDENGKKVTICGIITSIRKVFTRKSGSEMAFLTLSQDGEKIDIVLFPKVFEANKPLIISDNAVIIAGTVDWREDKLSVLADSFQAASQACNTPEDNQLTIEVKTGTSRETLERLNNLLKQHEGYGKVTIVFTSLTDSGRVIDLPYGVRITAGLKKEVRAILTDTYQ